MTDSETEDSSSPYEFGPQPLDALMKKWNLTDTDAVRASTRQLTFKMMDKGRRGRKLTANVQSKILLALRKLKPELNLTLKDLFNY